MKKSTSKKASTIQDRLEVLQTRVVVERDSVSSISSSDFPFHTNNQYPNHDVLERLRKKIKIAIEKKSQYDMEFDIIGIDASIANALRRIMIAEVPTMAIEKVFIYDNTSIIQDEVLAHRLGLIPIKADPDQFDFKQSTEHPTDQNTIVFKLKQECKRNPKATANDTDPKQLYINHNVYSAALTWEPKGDQAERFKNCFIGPVHDDILIAQMRPGQKIELEAHCEKGCGKEHAKWSPAATASYRLMPEIILKEEITGDLADKFASCFAPGVVEVEKTNVDGESIKVAKVVNPRIDTVSREVLRHKEFEDKVQLTRIRDHFIFRVESTGILDSEKIVFDSLQILSSKCTMLLKALDLKLKEKEEVDTSQKNDNAMDLDV
ncbi:DNA-directed RNA polymerase [Glomus cerebriforme]|uniref:DNA-directed RNA polymerases I and III subunit RPAC1 n=1 Tax=Glomus cerebriforme TaxID=658196 RepID=A0A397SR63_9GLOM|nr:DNA-directed RNA polymerase [Glomus cerebriforme]